jgi:hypothetical protein
MTICNWKTYIHRVRKESKNDHVNPALHISRSGPRPCHGQARGSCTNHHESLASIAFDLTHHSPPPRKFGLSKRPFIIIFPPSSSTTVSSPPFSLSSIQPTWIFLPVCMRVFTQLNPKSPVSHFPLVLLTVVTHFPSESGGEPVRKSTQSSSPWHSASSCIFRPLSCPAIVPPTQSSFLPLMPVPGVVPSAKFSRSRLTRRTVRLLSRRSTSSAGYL